MATMMRWDPFQDLRSAQDEMAQMSPMLAHALGLHAQQQSSATATAWAPALDISERKDAYLVTAPSDARSPCPPRSRPSRSRPRSTTACCRSWCPRWRRPGPSASRSAPAQRRSLRQAVVRTPRPVESSGGVAGPARPPLDPLCFAVSAIPTPTERPPLRRYLPQPRRTNRGPLMPRCPLCRSALVTIGFGLYPIAICTSCGARWIQDGTQQRAINQVQEPTLFASPR
jgi:hypothetical protein